MRQTKYIMSGGLAFSEDKDMDKLRRFSLKGWHVNDFKLMGYTLVKGDCSDYIYSVDYRSLKEDEEEYFNLFSSSGWSHIASEGDIHLFRAHPGTKPIYTDRETRSEKYRNSSNSMMKLAIPLAFITAFTWVGAIISAGILESLLIVAATFLSIIALPIAWTIMMTYSNKWKVEGRKGLVNLVKAIPFLILLIVAILLLFVGTADNDPTISLLTFMVAGAITLPTAVWAVMSLYHKIAGRKD